MRNLLKFSHCICYRHNDNYSELIFTYTVLHPYFKLHYIELAWGREKEQEKEIAAGNPHAKNWYKEVEKIVKSAVSQFSSFCSSLQTKKYILRWLSIGPLVH